MRNFKLIVLFCLISFSAMAQQKINGVVLDADQKPVEGAAISVLETPLGAITDISGKFVIKNVVFPAKLRVSFIGFETRVITVKDGNETLNVVLKEAPYVYNDFEVVATRAGENSPFAVENISSEKLKAINTGEALPELLSISPSLVSSTENGTPFGNTKFRIRGSDPSRINVTVDGIPLNDAESQTVFWVNMTDFTESLSDIQIQRGVGASTNGAASFGASVNLQTKAYDADPYGEVSTYLGSFNTNKNSLQVNSGLIKDHFVFNARLSSLSSDGYIDHSGMEHQSYFFSAGYFSDKTTLRFKMFGNEEHTDISWWGLISDSLKINRTFNTAGFYYDKNGNEKYYEDQQDNYWQNHYHLHFSQWLSADLTFKAALHYTKGKGYYEQYQDDANWLHDSDYEYYGFPSAYFVKAGSDTIYASDFTRQKWLDNDFYGGTFSFEYEKQDLQIIAGGAASRYDGDHFGKVLWAEFNPGIPNDYQYYFNNSIKDDRSAFVKATYGFNKKLYAYGDIQYRNVAYNMEGKNSDPDKPDLDIHENYNFLNPKAGALYVLNHHQKVFASLGVALREPSRANLKDAIGDPSSKPTPERLIDTEMGYEYQSSEFSFAATAYFMRYKDQLVPTGEKNNVGYDIMTNVPESYRTGLELAVAYTPTYWFKWEANATFSQNKIIDFTEYNTYYDEWYWNVVDYKGTPRGNTDIAYSPNVVGSSRLSFYPLRGMVLNLTSKYVGEQYFDNTSQEAARLDAYLVNDVSLRYRLPVKFAEYVDVTLLVNNVLNEDYISDAYGGKDMVQVKGSTTDFYEARWTYYFPQAFRNFALRLTMRF